MSINPSGGSFVSAISMVERPAIGSNFIAFAADKPEKIAIVEERRELFGAAMIPDLPMYRNTKGVGEYISVFTAGTIRQIAQEFAKQGFFNNMNVDHSERPAGSYVFQSYITDDTKGVVAPGGIDVPNGTWIVGVKVDDEQVWQEIKAGKMQGFSVEGLFNLIDLELDISIEQFNTLIEFEAAMDEIPKGCLMFFPEIDEALFQFKTHSLLPGAIEYEDNPHVTILFGLPDIEEMPDLLKAFLSNALNDNPINIQLGAISKFIQPDQDVIKIVINDTNGVLHDLNSFLGEAFAVQQDYNYTPHMTLAYMPTDETTVYSSDPVNSWDFGINNINKGRIVYSSADKVQTTLLTIA